MNSVRNFPQISVQHDWHDGLRNKEKVWISCSIPGEKTKYSEMTASSHDANRIQIIDGFQTEVINKRTLRLTYLELGISVTFMAPLWTFKNIHKKAVRCLDISSGGALGISCGDDGNLNIWNSSDGNLRRTLEGHVSDVTHCRFFPSGTVALSGGMDMRVKIWSAENGSCPRTMVGHKAAITDSAIVERGRNIITCSRDGKTRLWDCSKGQCIRVLSDAGCVINGCSLGTLSEQSADTRQDVAADSSGETGTSSKMLVLAREDGILEGQAVLSRTKLFEYQCQSAVNCCEYYGEMDVFAGCENGNIFHFDVRNSRMPVSVTRIGNSCINDIRRYSDSFLFAKGNGSVVLFNPTTVDVEHSVELTGPNLDAVYKISSHGHEVYTACRDAKVRRYSLEDMKT